MFLDSWRNLGIERKQRLSDFDQHYYLNLPSTFGINDNQSGTKLQLHEAGVLRRTHISDIRHNTTSAVSDCEPRFSRQRGVISNGRLRSRRRPWCNNRRDRRNRTGICSDKGTKSCTTVRSNEISVEPCVWVGNSKNAAAE